MPVDLLRRLRERAGVLGASLAVGGSLATTVAEAGKKRRRRDIDDSSRRDERDDRSAAREDRGDRPHDRNDDSGQSGHRQTVDDTANGGGGGRGGGNDPVGGRAGDAADKLRHRGEKLTGFDGKQKDNGGNNDTGTDYDGDGIDASVDPQTGSVGFDNGNISFIQNDDGSATIVTDNIELERGPDPKPFEFPPLELPEDDGLPTVPGSSTAPPAGDGTAPGSSAGDGGDANANADGGTVDTGNTDVTGGDNSTAPVS